MGSNQLRTLYYVRRNIRDVRNVRVRRNQSFLLANYSVARVTKKLLVSIHRVSEKTVQICFYQNFVKFPLMLITFGK